MSRRREPPLLDEQPYPKSFCSVQTAAIYLDIDERSVIKRLEEGRIAFERDGYIYRIDIVSLRNYRRRTKRPLAS